MNWRKRRGLPSVPKNTAVLWNQTKINIVDTPGHADFGGEVERILKMVNGVILLVDAAEGPLPQTKFVLRKSLDLGYQPIVVINKIDRKMPVRMRYLMKFSTCLSALDASDEQLDFPILYAVGIDGVAKNGSWKTITNDLTPLFETIDRSHSPTGTGLQMRLLKCWSAVLTGTIM
jgi:GTP-binding protein